MPSHRLILLAHGETDAIRRGLFPDDEPLNENGRAAAARLEDVCRQAAEVRSSPAPAAQETARLAGLSAATDPALRDIDLGRWRGRSFEAIAGSDPASAMAWIEDPTFAGHGGEAFAALIDRVAAWVAARLDAGGTTLAVTHATVVRAAAIAALDLPPPTIWRLEVSPLVRLVLGADGRRWTLRELTQGDLRRSRG